MRFNYLILCGTLTQPAASKGYQMSNRILPLPEVEIQSGLKKRTIYDKMADGSFPKPVQLTKRRVGWLQHEIDSWIADRVAERDNVAAVRAFS